MSEFRNVAIAAVLASFAVAPAFAQDMTMSCQSFTESSPADQATATEAMVMEVMGAEGSMTTMEEITSMLAEACNEFPDQPAIDQVRALPLEKKG